jgi:hypothetical protein
VHLRRLFLGRHVCVRRVAVHAIGADIAGRVNVDSIA